MEIKTKISNDCLIVSIIGELDMHSVSGFKEIVIDKMEKNKANNLILNFKGVNFIDSSGLGVILGRYRFLHNKGGKVMLVNLKPQVKKIFTLAGMLKIMDVFDNEKQAIEVINKGGCTGA